MHWSVRFRCRVHSRPARWVRPCMQPWHVAYGKTSHTHNSIWEAALPAYTGPMRSAMPGWKPIIRIIAGWLPLRTGGINSLPTGRPLAGGIVPPAFPRSVGALQWPCDRVLYLHSFSSTIPTCAARFRRAAFYAANASGRARSPLIINETADLSLSEVPRAVGGGYPARKTKEVRWQRDEKA